MEIVTLRRVPMHCAAFKYPRCVMVTLSVISFFVFTGGASRGCPLISATSAGPPDYAYDFERRCWFGQCRREFPYRNRLTALSECLDLDTKASDGSTNFTNDFGPYFFVERLRMDHSFIADLDVYVAYVKSERLKIDSSKIDNLYRLFGRLWKLEPPHIGHGGCSLVGESDPKLPEDPKSRINTWRPLRNADWYY